MTRTTPLLVAISLCMWACAGCLTEPVEGTSPDPSCDGQSNCASVDMDTDASPGVDSGGGGPVVIREDMGTPPKQDMSTPPGQDMAPDPEPEPVCASVTSCQAGDGCCPSGCDVTSDGDCMADCRDYDSWPQNWSDEEAELIALVNIERSKGANCGSKGSFPATGPVQSNRALQIAARCHSVDMVGRGGLDHTGTDGSSFSERARREGYAGSPRGENIAAGNVTAERTVGQWMGSDGHCANIMKDGIDRMGLGYFTGDVRFTHYWTMVTGVGGQ
jgi:uncharacterized protein YkwD